MVVYQRRIESPLLTSAIGLVETWLSHRSIEKLARYRAKEDLIVSAGSDSARCIVSRPRCDASRQFFVVMAEPSESSLLDIQVGSFIGMPTRSLP